MNKILRFNVPEKWARVEPGVVLDELNMKLKEQGLLFGSGNFDIQQMQYRRNGWETTHVALHSVIYGSTRDHTIELKTILSDGSEEIFGPVDKETFEIKCKNDTYSGKIYRNIKEILSNPENRKSIQDDFPDPLIPEKKHRLRS